ncbi:MAG: hypothetical protein EZS28_043868, partial [Streblomastix strix]
MATIHSHEQVVTIGDQDKEKCRWILQLDIGWDELGDVDSLIEKIGQVATSIEDFRNRYIYPQKKLQLFQRITQTGIRWIFADWLSKQLYQQCYNMCKERGQLQSNNFDKKSKYDMLRPLLFFRHGVAPRPSTETTRAKQSSLNSEERKIKLLQIAQLDEAREELLKFTGKL